MAFGSPNEDSPSPDRSDEPHRFALGFIRRFSRPGTELPAVGIEDSVEERVLSSKKREGGATLVAPPRNTARVLRYSSQ